MTTPKRLMVRCPNIECKSYDLMFDGKEDCDPYIEQDYSCIDPYFGKCKYCGIRGPKAKDKETARSLWNMSFVKPFIDVIPGKLSQDSVDKLKKFMESKGGSEPNCNRIRILEDPTKGQSREDISIDRNYVMEFGELNEDGIPPEPPYRVGVEGVDGEVAFRTLSGLDEESLEGEPVADFPPFNTSDGPEVERPIEHINIKIGKVDAEGNPEPLLTDDWWCGKCERGFSHSEALLASGRVFFHLGTQDEHLTCPTCGHVLAVVTVCDSCGGQEAEPKPDMVDAIMFAHDVARDDIEAHTSRCPGLGCQPTVKPTPPTDGVVDAYQVALDILTDDWWCNSCEVGFGDQEIENSSDLGPLCPRCGGVVEDAIKGFRDRVEASSNSEVEVMGPPDFPWYCGYCEASFRDDEVEKKISDGVPWCLTCGDVLKDSDERLYNCEVELNTERFSDDSKVVAEGLKELADEFGVSSKTMGDVIEGVTKAIDDAVIDPDKEGD